MKFFDYIIYSSKLNKYYVGFTSDLNQRIKNHNSGISSFTSKGIPWELKYFETYLSESDARIREKEIKNKKSRRYIEYLISHLVILRHPRDDS
ncbi:MAG: GIY-YIG nuclease family protein [Bacteroidota bacterium]|nr:GIY-YIG nuclease family protein [Bacteroidota bacterium]